MAEGGSNHELWRSPAVPSPSTDQLKVLSEELKLQCSEEDIKEFKRYIDEEVLDSYNRVEELVPPTLQVKYPRTPGYRPDPKENTNNAWFWKCDIAGAPDGKLAGKRIGIKDSICVAGVPMMYGSKQLEGYVPDIDATVISRILDAGGRIAGKTSCEHLCLSGSSWACDFGPVTNPHNPLHTSGGSSGGSAVALVNGDIDLALGGDQGGSIRIPSSWCGIVGLKPTWGLVPYTGAIPIEISVDHLGPMAKNVTDCALLLEVIAGYDNGLDPRQPPNIAVPEYSKLLTGDLAGKKIGVVKEGYEKCETDVLEYVQRAAESLTGAGAEVEEVSIPLHKDGHHIWTAICVEGTYKCMIKGNGNSYHWKGFYPLSFQEALNKGYKTRPQEFSDVIKLVCLFSEYIDQNYQNRFYAKGHNLNLLLTEAYNKALSKYDVLIMPTCPYKAPKLPGKNDTIFDRLKNALGMVQNTAPFDSTGHPALTIDVGRSEGLPVGMMIVGKHFDETSVLQVAYAYEKLRDGE